MGTIQPGGENLRKAVKWLSDGPHPAGSRKDVAIAEWINDAFHKVGMDFVTSERFESFLSFGDPLCPNRVELLDANNLAIFSTVPQYSSSSSSCVASGSSLREGRIYDDARRPQPFMAYSPRGEAEGFLVYANYGTKEDFLYLRRVGNVDLANRIAIVRTGRVNVANKVRNAQREGMGGVIVYSDPEEVAPEGSRDTLPDSLWLPGDGVKVGHLHLGRGDPATPGNLG